MKDYTRLTNRTHSNNTTFFFWKKVKLAWKMLFCDNYVAQIDNGFFSGVGIGIQGDQFMEFFAESAKSISRERGEMVKKVKSIYNIK